MCENYPYMENDMYNIHAYVYFSTFKNKYYGKSPHQPQKNQKQKKCGVDTNIPTRLALFWNLSWFNSLFINANSPMPGDNQ